MTAPPPPPPWVPPAVNPPLKVVTAAGSGTNDPAVSPALPPFAPSVWNPAPPPPRTFVGAIPDVTSGASRAACAVGCCPAQSAARRRVTHSKPLGETQQPAAARSNGATMPFHHRFPYRSWMKSVALLVLLFAACTKRNPETCCTTQGDCDAIGLPVGTDCGDGLMCLGNRCVATTTCQAPSDCPSATPQCNAEGVCVECLETSECGNQVCGSTGQCVACIANDECDTGFCSEGTCRSSIIPKYLPNICDTESSSDLLLPPTLDTSDGTGCTEILSQGVGLPDICVVHAKSITVSGTVRVTGSRALALVADQTLEVEGALEAGGKGSQPGPGVIATSAAFLFASASHRTGSRCARTRSGTSTRTASAR